MNWPFYLGVIDKSSYNHRITVLINLLISIPRLNLNLNISLNPFVILMSSLALYEF